MFRTAPSRCGVGLVGPRNPVGRMLRLSPRVYATKLESFEMKGKDLPVTLAVLGDLHIGNSVDEPLFSQAIEQINGMAAEDEFKATRVVQLGDLGSSKIGPGSRLCFSEAHKLLQRFACPFLLITGNHDLEGAEFETDAENLKAWQEEFGQPHYWAVEAGPALLIGLSTVQFRSAEHSVHEVYVDPEQLAWFEATVQKHADRPVIVFSHAPPIGSGLQVIQELHVKNRCAWLNHSHNPEVFVQICRRNPNIKAWLSGHFHLSHNYPSSISHAEGSNCAFIQTGVIGKCNRDGERQSRILKLLAAHFEVHTLDHETGRLRLDLRHDWAASSPPEPVLYSDSLFCDPNRGWLCSRDLVCAVGANVPGVEWIPVGSKTMLAVEEDAIVEYDIDMKAPIGVVSLERRGRDVRLVDWEGRPVVGCVDGSSGAALQILEADGTVAETIPRNDRGFFYRIYQPNRWKAKKAAAAAAAAQASV